MLLPNRPKPWTIRKFNDSCFIVSDATGRAIGYFYYRPDLNHLGFQSEDDAKEAAQAFARLSIEKQSGD